MKTRTTPIREVSWTYGLILLIVIIFASVLFCPWVKGLLHIDTSWMDPNEEERPDTIDGEEFFEFSMTPVGSYLSPTFAYGDLSITYNRTVDILGFNATLRQVNFTVTITVRLSETHPYFEYFTGARAFRVTSTTLGIRERTVSVGMDYITQLYIPTVQNGVLISGFWSPHLILDNVVATQAENVGNTATLIVPIQCHY